MSIDYKQAGVDVEAGYKAVELMKKHVKSTFNSNVLGDIGSFGGFYSLAGNKMEEPVLVAGTDGVGTKLKYAFITGRHNTIGIDCVAMCVNDVVCQGARPLFFLDYIALGKLQPEKVAEIVSGVAEGCRQSGCALIGGETAEMPGFYSEGEYDMAGFCVGLADRAKIINGSRIAEGDALIGFASSGIHSNGYSLVRKLFGEDAATLNVFSPELGKTIAEELLTPTRIYVKPVLALTEKFDIKGIAHITGGGFIENIPRIIPEGLCAEVNAKSYEVPPVFKLIKKLSGAADKKLYNTFNMGVGMVIAVAPEAAAAFLAEAEALGEKACLLGKIVKGAEKIVIKGIDG